jgi:transposase
MNASITAEALLAKLQALPPERLAQVADFIEFLATHERRTKAGEALRQMWARMPREEITAEIEAEIDEAVHSVRAARGRRGDA